MIEDIAGEIIASIATKIAENGGELLDNVDSDVLPSADGSFTVGGLEEVVSDGKPTIITSSIPSSATEVSVETSADAVKAKTEVCDVFKEKAQIETVIQSDRCSGAIEMFKDFARDLAVANADLGEGHPLHDLVEAAEANDSKEVSRISHELAQKFGFWDPTEVKESALLQEHAKFVLTDSGSFLAYDGNGDLIASANCNGEIVQYGGAMLDSEPCLPCDAEKSCVPPTETTVTERIIEKEVIVEVEKEVIVKETEIVYVDRPVLEALVIPEEVPADLYEPPAPPEGVPCTIDVIAYDSYGRITKMHVDFHEASGRYFSVTGAEDVSRYITENPEAFDTARMELRADGYVYDRGASTGIRGDNFDGEAPRGKRIFVNDRLVQVIAPNGTVEWEAPRAPERDSYGMRGGDHGGYRPENRDQGFSYTTGGQTIREQGYPSYPYGAEPRGAYYPGNSGEFGDPRRMGQPMGVPRERGFFSKLGDVLLGAIDRTGVTPQGDVYVGIRGGMPQGHPGFQGDYHPMQQPYGYQQPHYGQHAGGSRGFTYGG